MIVPVFLNKGTGERIVLNQAESYFPAGFPVENPTPSFWTSSAPDANPLAFEGSDGRLLLYILSNLLMISVPYNLCISIVYSIY